FRCEQDGVADGKELPDEWREDFDRFGATEKFVEEDVDFQFCEARAEAVVGTASAERYVRVRCSSDVKGEGVGEDFVVAIRRRIPERDPISCLDRNASNLHVDRGAAREVRDRRCPAKNLVDRAL